MTKSFANNLLGVSTLGMALALCPAVGFGQQPQPANPSTMGSPGNPGATPGTMGQPNAAGTMPAGQTSDQHMDMGAKKMAKGGDQAFVLKAAQGGMAEVMTGKLAAEKASDPDVKAYGQMMVDDHTKANEQLKSIASQKGMTIPDSTDPKHQAIYEKLSKMQGADFDKAYTKAMLKDHEEDVKEFQKESEKGKDEQIKSFASTTLPTLQQHLDKVKSLQGKTASAAGTK